MNKPQYVRSLDKNLLDTKLLFGRIAHKYNIATKLFSFNRDASWKQKLINSLGHYEKPVCLDIACGTGDLTFALAKRYTNGIIVGIDITPEMLAQARRLNQTTRITFMCQDMACIALPDNSVDIITAGYALSSAPNLSAVLLEIKRILKPGGTVAFLDFSKSDKKYKQQLGALFLNLWGACCGLFMHGKLTIYTRVIQNLRYFPDKKALVLLLHNNGFHLRHTKQFFFGLARLIIVQKDQN